MLSASVQLRPFVRPIGKVLEYDISLFDRLYNKPEHPQVSHIMLDVGPLQF